jgi:hypothetical protein
VALSTGQAVSLSVDGGSLIQAAPIRGEVNVVMLLDKWKAGGRCDVLRHIWRIMLRSSEEGKAFHLLQFWYTIHTRQPAKTLFNLSSSVLSTLVPTYRSRMLLNLADSERKSCYESRRRGWTVAAAQKTWRKINSADVLTQTDKANHGD